MELDQIKQELKLFLNNMFRIKQLENSDNIFETGAIHSLFFIQLLVFIEKKFQIELKVGTYDVTQLKSINEIAHFIHQVLLQNQEA